MNEQLPPLPEGSCASEWGGRTTGPYLYTPDQMRAYAAAAVSADRDAICRLVFGLCGSDNDAQRIVDAIRAMK